MKRIPTAPIYTYRRGCECFFEFAIDRLPHRPTKNLTLLVTNGVYFSIAVEPKRFVFLWLKLYCHITLAASNENSTTRNNMWVVGNIAVNTEHKCTFETNWMEKFSRLCSRIGLNTSRLSEAANR